jgi:hypothetical protein
MTQVGEYRAAWLTLTFNNTSVGGIAGQTYDPANHLTTNPQLSNVAGSNLFDVCGIKQVLTIFCPQPSSAALGNSAAGAFTGTVRLTWSDSVGAFFLTCPGAGNAGGATDPLTAADEAQLANTAGAMAQLTFRLLVIGR